MAEQRFIRTAPVPPRVDLRSRISDANEFVYGGRWVLVKSSNCHAIRYDYREHRLFVQFGGKRLKGGGESPIATYAYEGCGVDVAKHMFNCASMGKYVHQVLKKGGYPYRNIT